MSTVNLSGGFNLQPVDNPSVQNCEGEVEENDKVLIGEAHSDNEKDGGKEAKKVADEGASDEDADE